MPEDIKRLLKNIWANQADIRPEAHEIIDDLKNLLESNKLCEDLEKSIRNRRDENSLKLEPTRYMLFLKPLSFFTALVIRKWFRNKSIAEINRWRQTLASTKSV